MGVVGRHHELLAVRAALEAGAHVLLEGPPGTGKSTVLRRIAAERAQPLHMVEGSAHLTPPRLMGYHLPAAVAAHGYRPQDFVAGSLVAAMRDGGLLYIEEINRVPSDTLDVLLGPLNERRLEVPRVGEVRAAEGFRLIGAMNPFDNVGTHQLGRSLLDRFVRLAVDYQSEDDERRIVAQHVDGAPSWLREAAMLLTRATRRHADVQMGASVRGAVDLCALAGRLADLEDTTLERRSEAALRTVLEAALLALSGRILLTEASGTSAEAVITELWEDLFVLAPGRARGDKTIDLDAAIELTGRRTTPRHRQRAPTSPGAPAQLPPPAALEEAPKVLGRGHVAVVGAAPPGPSRSGRPEGDERAAPVVEVGAQDVQHAFADDPHKAVGRLRELWSNADEEARALIQRLAVRIVLAVARTTSKPVPGRGPLRSQRYRFQSDDLDLDRTLEEIAGKAYPEYEDIWVFERGRSKRTVVLLLDVSGSMQGDALLTAAMAVGAVATAVAEDDWAVVAFWRDAAVLKAVQEERDLTDLIGDLLAVRAHGLTNVAHGLEVGLRELEQTADREKVGLIVTDGVHNLGTDPQAIAARWPRLHVIATSSSPLRLQACEDLAAAGRGRCVVVEKPGDIPSAVTTCMSA